MVTDIRIGTEYHDSVHKYSDEQLASATAPLEIPWEPGVAQVIEAHPDVKFIIFVPNVKTMATVAERLSRGLKFDIVTLETGSMALMGKSTDKKWADVAKSLGPLAARALLLRLVARAIERGNKIGGLASIAEGTLTDGIRPMDADILGRARNLRNQK